MLAFLFLKLVVDGRGRSFIAVLLLQAALQSLIISLGQHYGVAWARAIQPITAAAIPPLAWVAFETSAVRRFTVARHTPHGLVPVFIAFCVVFARAPLDALIPAIFMIYGGMILIGASKGADALPDTALSAGHLPGLIWRIIGASLVISALGDALIVAAQVMDRAAWQPWIIAVSSTGMLVLLGGLSLSRSLWTSDNVSDLEPEPPLPPDTAADAKIMERLETLMVQQRLYLDPDLTLNQIARRLVLPTKSVSAAINRATGENISRYVNKHRIEAACAALLVGENVTTAMLSAGFNTKSNFNREFLRIKQMPPGKWLDLAQSSAG